VTLVSFLQIAFVRLIGHFTIKTVWRKIEQVPPVTVFYASNLRPAPGVLHCVCRLDSAENSVAGTGIDRGAFLGYRIGDIIDIGNRLTILSARQQEQCVVANRRFRDQTHTLHLT
jgi:hypothetical protein